MSAELETLLNDLTMKAEKENAAFMRELANAELVAQAAEQMRQLNEQAFNRAMLTMQRVRQTMIETQHPAPQSLPSFLGQAWN